MSRVLRRMVEKIVFLTLGLVRVLRNEWSLLSLWGRGGFRYQFHFEWIGENPRIAEDQFHWLRSDKAAIELAQKFIREADESEEGTMLVPMRITRVEYIWVHPHYE